MAKKSFGKGIDALFSTSADSIDKAIKPKEQKTNKTTERRRPEIKSGTTHKLTCNLDIELFEKIKAISHAAAVPITDVVVKSLEDFLTTIKPEDLEEALVKLKDGPNKYGL